MITEQQWCQRTATTLVMSVSQFNSTTTRISSADLVQPPMILMHIAKASAITRMILATSCLPKGGVIVTILPDVIKAFNESTVDGLLKTVTALALAVETGTTTGMHHHTRRFSGSATGNMSRCHTTVDHLDIIAVTGYSTFSSSSNHNQVSKQEHYAIYEAHARRELGPNKWLIENHDSCIHHTRCPCGGIPFSPMWFYYSLRYWNHKQV